jgi:cytochrome b
LLFDTREHEADMKALIVLALWSPLLFLGPSSVMAAERDRDASDRQTREESDELRADIRQRRLKRVKTLDDLSKPLEQPQKQDEQSEPSKPIK